MSASRHLVDLPFTVHQTSLCPCSCRRFLITRRASETRHLMVPIGASQHRADLLVAVVAGLRQQQRVAQLRRQRANRVGGCRGPAARCAAACSGDGPSAAISGHQGVGLVLCLRRDHPPPDAGHGSSSVDRLIPCDRQQPCLEARIPAKAGEAAIRQQKRVLRGVFRVGRRAQRGQRRAIDRRAMPIHELAERGRVALPGPRDQVDIAHTDCRHCRAARGWALRMGLGLRA